MVLYEDYQKRHYDKMKFTAAMQGVNLDKEAAKEEKEKSILFKAPDEYEHLSKEDATKLTQNMLLRHRKELGERENG